MGEERASTVASKVQEAAASLQQATTQRQRITGPGSAEIVRAYFQALGERDLETAVSLWEPGGREHVRGLTDIAAPEGIRDFFGELLQALPDLRVEVLSTTSEGDRCVAHWRFVGTFAGPGQLGGLAPTDDPIVLEGLDLFTVRDGLIRSNDAFTDTLSLPRQVGMMPAAGSAAQQRMTGAFNAKTRLTSGLAAAEPGLVAEGVWLIQGQPGRCNVFLIEDDGALTLFDAGARTMTRAVAHAGATRGGIRRVVLSHGHTDHRGVAGALGVPVLCHPAEVQDAEGSGGFRYWSPDLAELPTPQRQIHRLLHRYAYGGPVDIAATVEEGDRIAGFEVIHLPGHAPGLIGLWRESDRLALVSDCFETIDLWGRDAPAHVPEPAYNLNTEQARESICKLAALQPAVAWPGHGRPLTGDVRAQLLQAARAV
ncbi:MAG TPA: nuclear transport factor 2 family protein [Solirubrobacteraceae bacterium]|nr:nuclear transport factor 2 family protein [Solirubrobacteraceae bacterium]